MRTLNILLTSSLLMFICHTTLVAQMKPQRTGTISHTPLHTIEPLTQPIFGVPMVQNNLMNTPQYGRSRVLDKAAFQPYRVLLADDNQLPVWIEWKGAEIQEQDPIRWGQAMLAQLSGAMLQQKPGMSWEPGRIIEEGNGSLDISFIQSYKGIPIDAAEVRLHRRTTLPTIIQGRYYPAFGDVNVQPGFDAQQAMDVAKQHIKARPLPVLPVGTVPVLPAPALVIFMVNDEPKLAWHMELMANPMHRYTVYVDAITGQILQSRLETCSFKANYIETEPDHHCAAHENTVSEEEVMNGPGTANAADLLGISRFIHTYEVNNTWYMLDGSRSTFNLAASQLPNDPAGAILTVNALNTSPENSSFQAVHVTSSNNVWNNPAAISAHYNAGKSFEYFKDTLKRNSINGQGGTILSYINVAESDGSSMDNAFWNGESIFYGNGNTAFFSLARSLDVAAHEMTHGVVQATANLVYQNESGALNESYADIYGAMVDRDDWLIGEEVVKLGAFPSGAMRSLSNPHNGGTGLSSPGWQPKHTNEQYKGSQDNGGVHINSGIPNHAFFLFASQAQVGKARAEQVFYKALTTYLVKSSKFLDLRFAVIQSCKDLYGAGTPLVMLAEQAFNSVGIGSGFSGGGTPDDYQDELAVNPGQQFLILTDDAYSTIYFSNTDGSNLQAISNTDLISRPSITDDGTSVVFVGSDKRIYLLTIDYSTGNINETILQNQPMWDHVAVAKDGSRIAATTDDIDNVILVFDFGLQAWEEFELYNPTFTEGVETAEVQYPDVIEFDHSGNYVMYDAFNEIQNQNGYYAEYWDIGFLEVWNKGLNGFAQGDIFKLFNNLPENTSIANPTFAKNAPYVMAFDFIDDFTGENAIYGANLENGEIGLIFENDVLGYPNYSVDDKKMVFNATSGFFSDPALGIIDLETNRIEGKSATAKVLIDGGQWGVWFANGSRPLTDVETEVKGQNIRVYPNPGTSFIAIDGFDQSVQVSVMDMLGRTVYMKEDFEPGQSIATNGWAPGLYRVLVTDNRSIYRFAWMLAKQ
jgi:bacillolysin